MAGFVENVGRPESVTGGIPVHESAGNLIGGALEGAAKLLDVGLKAGAKMQTDKINSELEDKLAKATQDWGPHAQAPQFISPTGNGKFVGDTDTAQDAMGSAPGIQQGMSQIEAWRQSNKQGRTSTAEFMGRASGIVQQMIHDHPRFADAIRERAQGILGTNPTAEMLKLNREDEQATANSQREMEMRFANVVTEAGAVPVLDANGQFDLAANAGLGQTLQAQKYHLENDLKNAELQHTQAETDRLNHPKPTAEELNHEQQTVMEQNVDPIFKRNIQNIEAEINRMKATDFATMSPKDVASYQTTVYNRVNGLITSLNSQVDYLISNLPANQRDPANVKAVKEYYADQLKPLLDVVSSHPEQYEFYVHAVQTLEANAKMDFGEAAKGLSNAMYVFGPSIVAPLASLMLQPGTPLGKEAAREMFEGLKFVTKVGNGESTAGLTDPSHGAAAAAVIKDWNDHPEHLTGVKPEVYENLIHAATNAGVAQQGDWKAIQAATNVLSGPGSMAAFDQFRADKNNASKVVGVATDLLEINLQNINTQGHNLQTSTLKNQLPVIAGSMGRMSDRVDITYGAQYNADTGRMELSITDGKGGNLSNNRDLLRSAPPGLLSQIKGINASLQTREHLQEFGGDRVAAMPPDQYKLLTIQSAGIPVVGHPPSMDKALEKPAKKEVPPAKSEPTDSGLPEGWSITGGQ